MEKQTWQLSKDNKHVKERERKTNQINQREKMMEDENTGDLRDERMGKRRKWDEDR